MFGNGPNVHLEEAEDYPWFLAEKPDQEAIRVVIVEIEERGSEGLNYGTCVEPSFAIDRDAPSVVTYEGSNDVSTYGEDGAAVLTRAWYRGTGCDWASSAIPDLPAGHYGFGGREDRGVRADKLNADEFYVDVMLDGTVHSWGKVAAPGEQIRVEYSHGFGAPGMGSGHNVKGEVTVAFQGWLPLDAHQHVPHPS